MVPGIQVSSTIISKEVLDLFRNEFILLHAVALLETKGSIQHPKEFFLKV